MISNVYDIRTGKPLMPAGLAYAPPQRPIAPAQNAAPAMTPGVAKQAQAFLPPKPVDKPSKPKKPNSIADFLKD